MPSINTDCFEKCICSTCKFACHKTKKSNNFCYDCNRYPTAHCSGYKKMSYSRYTRKFKNKLISVLLPEEIYHKKKPI